MAATNTTLNAGETTTPAIALSASTVDTVTFNLFTPYIEIDWDGASTGSVTVDGSTPTLGGAKTFPLPATACVRTIRLGPSLGRNPVVKLISGATPSYTVIAVQSPQTP